MPNNAAWSNPGTRQAPGLTLSAIYRAVTGVTAPGITATASSSSAVSIGLSDAGTGAEPFTLERSLDGSNWSVVSTSLTSASFPYSDTGRSASTLYYYRIKATDSDYSSTVSTTTSAASGGEPLAFSADSFDEGGTLTITTDGTYNFGATRPIVMYYDNYSGVTAGSQASTTPIAGRATVTANINGTPFVADVPEMPYGKAIEIGNNTTDNTSSSLYSQLIIVDTEVSTESYEHTYIYNPSAHHDAQISGATAAGSELVQWQIKSDWEMLNNNGNSDSAAGDIFAGTPAWDVNDVMWSAGGKFSSNDAPVSTFDGTDPGFMDPANPGRWRSNPIIRQVWKKCGPTAGSAASSDGMYRVTDTVTGLIEEKTYTGTGYWTGSSNSPIGWDRRKVPGFVRGFPRGANTHIYYGEMYRAVGSGSCRRLEIGDASTYAACKKLALCTPKADGTWSELTADYVVRKGVFYGESLTGKYLYFTDANNQTVLVGQIGA